MMNVILCGGSGTRLWPVSRTLMPKQFVQMFHGKSLFQETAKRNHAVAPRQFIVANAEQYFIAADQLSEMQLRAFAYLLEPEGRNTAPAIALAALAVDPDDVLLVTPSDHTIGKQKEYEQTVNRAKELAEEGYLVTFGIKPRFAETGYGYIEADGEKVVSFREKPDAQTAQTFVEKGNYYWNSGMFAFKAGVFLEELNRHAPKIFTAARSAYENMSKTRSPEDPYMRIGREDMLQIPEDSIDFAVLEKSDKVRVVSADIDWNDLGSFDSIAGAFPKDENSTVTITTGQENLQNVSIDSRNNMILQSDRIIATVDIEDLIIVDTPDALLISKKGSSQKVKKVVQELKARDSSLPNIHLTAHRPWGTYTVLEISQSYQIKKIVVKPGKRLSLQKHFHRNEHWIVVSGTASVVVGKEEMIIRANESTYIPMGEVHRLSNPGKIDLVLIEVQVGEYLGEDDIVRIEDDFKR